MEFDFNKLKNDVFAAGKTAGDKVNEASAYARYKMQIRSKQEFIEKQFTELGRMYFEEHKDDTDIPESEAILSIKEAQAELAALEQELTAKQGAVVCPQCGMKQSKDHAFCSGCGAPLQ